MRLTLKAMRRRARELRGAEIRALEGQRYMVVLQLDGTGAVLSDDQGTTLLFSSLREANDTLRHSGVSQRELVHESPYNEMIGLDEAGVDPLRITTGRHS